MSHVSTTAHYNLPIYGGSDIINPLTDVNGTNEALDTAIYQVAQELASGVTDITDVKNKVGDASLDTASQNLSGAVNELKSASDAQAGDITDIEASVGTLQSQMATTTGNITTLNTTVAGLQTEVSGKASQTAVNTLATKVGTDALITTAQDLSGAVNELKNGIDGLDAGDVEYDNTTSGLSATSVQGAIDELVSRTPDITITCDGVKTLKQVLNELALAIDFTKVNYNTKICAQYGASFIQYGSIMYQPHIGKINGSYLVNNAGYGETFVYCVSIDTTLNECAAYTQKISNNGVVFTDQSSLVTGNGDKFYVYY
jgi:hypothetical protein